VGLVDDSGVLVERYEYTPYGRRTVMRGIGSNDPLCSAPSLTSQRLSSGSVIQPYGICEVGHQGLMHDEETDLIYNRARMLHPILGRFIQRDPLGYVDGLSLYQYVGSAPLMGLDPTGRIPLDTLWDAASVIYDAAKVVKNTAELAYEGTRWTYYYSTNNTAGRASAAAGLRQDGREWLSAGGDLALDGGAMAVPYVPAGMQRLRKAPAAARALRGADKAADVAKKTTCPPTPKEGIYQFPDRKAPGQQYVGQSGNIPQRLNQHEAAGRLERGTETTTEVLGGRTAREVAEHRGIQEITGGQKAANSPAVSNQRDPIGPDRRPGLGLPEPRP
jgi:RHS repeat-associated protein